MFPQITRRQRFLEGLVNYALSQSRFINLYRDILDPSLRKQFGYYQDWLDKHSWVQQEFDDELTKTYLRREFPVFMCTLDQISDELQILNTERIFLNMPPYEKTDLLLRWIELWRKSAVDNNNFKD